MLSPKVIDYFNYENLELCIRAELLLPSPQSLTLKKALLELICQNFFGYGSVYTWRDSPTLWV